MMNSDNYNYVSADIFRKTLNAQTSTAQNALKELIKNQYTPDGIGGTIFYAAIVLRVEDEESPSEEPFGLSFFFSTGKATTKIRKYRVKIPELQRGLPAVEVFPELKDIKNQSVEVQTALAEAIQKLKDYPIVSEFNPNNPDNQTIRAGDAVWVMFQNSRTLENGFLFAKIVGGGSVGVNTLSKNQIAVGDGVKNSPLSPPAQLEQQPNNSAPPGYKKELGWAVDYSAIIDLMASSKGAPYRFGWYPQIYRSDGGGIGLDNKVKNGIITLSDEEVEKLAKERPNVNIQPEGPWEYNQIGVDCSGYIRRCLIRLGLVDINKKHTVTINGISYKNDTISKIFTNLTAGQFSYICDPIPTGKQIPGDLCIHGKLGGINGEGTHITLVVSYPDSSKGNESVVWGVQGSGPKCDASEPDCGVGSAKNKGQSGTSNLFNPVYGGDSWYPKSCYWRIKKEYRSGEWPFMTDYKTVEKSFPRQYIYPSEINQFASAVISAPDLFQMNRMNLSSKSEPSPSGVGKPPEV